MQLTIDLPNLWDSEKKTAELINRIEQFFIKENVSFEIKTASPAEPDSWDLLDIDEISVDTDIKDFAQNHDHYLYGTPKKS
jgi:cell division septal protein FtsQ